MAGEDTAPNLKDIHIDYSLIPTTPTKPDSTKQQPICTNWHENHLGERCTLACLVSQANLSEPGRLPGDCLYETEIQIVPACFGSSDLINASSVSDNWKAGEAANSLVRGDNLSNFATWQAGEVANSHVYGEGLPIYDKFPVKEADKLTNMSFRNLLALAQAGANKVAVENALRHTDFVATSSNSASCFNCQIEGSQLESGLAYTDFVATSSSSNPHFHPQLEGNQFTMSFGNSSLQDLENLPGTKFVAALNIPNVPVDGSSIPSRPFFDLNSLPRTITDAASCKSTSSQFEPITPEKMNKAEYRQESAVIDLSTDDVPAGQDAEEITRHGVLELHTEKEKSHLVINQLCPATSTQLQENYKPDKGGTKEVDWSRTPQQKPRRKKHRPKVVIEGQHKSTPKSRAEKTTVLQETTRVKRKYIRRKGVNNPTEGGTDLNKKAPSSMDTPVRKRNYATRKGINQPEGDMDKGATEATDATAPRRTRSSCRRSLNFNTEGQTRDECSSYCPSSNCDREMQAENFNAKDQSKTLQYKGGMKVVMEEIDMGTSLEPTHSMNQVWVDHLARPEQHSPSPLPSTSMDPLKDDHIFRDQIEYTRGKCQIVFSDVTHDKEANTVQVVMNLDGQRTPKSPSDSICSSTCLPTERQVRGFKRQNLGKTAEAELCNRNEIGTFYNSLQAYLPIFSQNASKKDEAPGLHFPAIYKKRRTEKGHNTVTSSLQYTASTSDNHEKLERHALWDPCMKLFTSTTNQGSSGAQCQVTNLLTTNHATDGTQNGRQVFEDLLALGPTERIKKRRSKGPTRLRDLASLLEICKELPAASGRAATSRIEQNVEILHEPHTCMEALVADTRLTVMTKKRSKRSMLSNSTVQNLYNHLKSASTSMGPSLALPWKCMSPIDSIIEQLNQLDLNAESRQASAQMQNAFTAFHTHYQQQHALVPFQRYGDVVPFDNSFDQVRRRRPRPKVDLDDETTRVWKLLLENINSEGIDGTDEEKTKWWEEERRVFRGRADSFIARMHLVQGDRRFSPWKGSVVDSVVGVFLTQNVSDHLSSSAFMSLAARFSLESKINPAELHEEKLGTQIKEPEVCVLDPDGTFALNKGILNRSVCGEDTNMLQDFEDDSIREVNSVKSSSNSLDGFVPTDDLRGQSTTTLKQGPVVSHETIVDKSINLIEYGRETEDTLSSQTSDISSQNSANSPIAQTTRRSASCVLSTSELTAAVKPDGFISSDSCLKLFKMADSVLNGDKKMPDQNRQVLSESSAVNLQDESPLDNPTFPATTVASSSKSSWCHVSFSGAQATECDLTQKNGKFFDTSSDKELCATEISELWSESASGTTFQKSTAVSFEEGPKLSSPNAYSSNNDQIEINQNKVGNQTAEVPPPGLFQENNYKMQEVSNIPIYPQNLMDVTGSSSNIDNSKNSEHKEVNSNKNDSDFHPSKMIKGPKAKVGKTRKEKENQVDWDHLRKQAQASGRERDRTANTMDSVDWDAVRCADVNEIAQTIKERGMNNMLAERIKDFLNRLVRDHGSIDLEWLRDVPPDKAKEYLLSIRGLGLKSVECVRLLTLHHLAFPVDTNVGRIAVRLGWVPLQPLPESLQLHLLELYPVLESIQKYLWPRLCKLDQRTLYELHYQMITFGKVFCTKSKPNCNACPMRGECRHFASAFASARLALPAPEEKSIITATENRTADQNPMRSTDTLQLPSSQANQLDAKCGASNSQPIIEVPATPEPIVEVPATPEPIIEIPATPEPIIEVPATPEPCYTQVPECDIEGAFNEDPDEIPTIQLNMEQFTHNLQKIMQQNTELQEGDMSKALVALTSEAASIPVPKLKNVSRLRTEHQVYELPDSHPLLEGMDKREPDDPCPYLLAIWTPGETVDSIEPPERRCISQGFGNLCTDETCSSCNSIREANSQTVRGTLLIPCRTAMRGSFPLNGTYFQVNEVFSDHESSLTPIDVPRQWLWNLPRRTVYFGTSIPTIFKGLSTEGIQYCFWRGFVCVRGFDRKTRAPRPLIARLHFPASRLAKGKGKMDEN